MIKKVCLLLVGLFLLPLHNLYGGEMKIAVVDMNKILNESKEGSKAKLDMKKRYEELKLKIDKRQEELKKIKGDIERQKIILGKDKMKEKEEEFGKEMGNFRKLVAESEKEMRETEAAYTKNILNKIRDIVKKSVKEKGYVLVIDKSGGVVYVDDSIDVSKSVLEVLNKETGSGKN
jgi:outer membrane protein